MTRAIPIDLKELKRLSLEELEDLYASLEEVSIPVGDFRGHHLGWIDHPRGPKNPLTRPALSLGFKRLPFGVDFDRRRWWFVHRAAPRLGHFVPVIGGSRWRRTKTVRLHYEVSSLPDLVQRTLYDEVKPLSEELCLGIGGLNAVRGQGEHFWFALERLR